MKEIDYALVETKRPAMYTAMKYWGKKPHNIWAKYIENYTEEGEVVLDPFSGSAISAFESIKLGRKAIAFDINPLTSFLIEVYSTSLDVDKLKESVKYIKTTIGNNNTYKDLYVTRCDFCGEEVEIQHFKWNDDNIYEYGIICPHCGKRYLIDNLNKLDKNKKEIENIEIDSWIPEDEFYSTPSFTNAFLKKIGGKKFHNIWTKRNLFVLSKIFELINMERDIDIKYQLMFGFIQTLHLSSKMCVPRNKKSNRDFSTSWGRSAYLCSTKQMEMNPLILFENNCLGKQSVESALKSVSSHLGKKPNIHFVNEVVTQELINRYDIIYGMVDIKKIDTVLPKNIVDFIITDPPYGGLVQYLDLSQVWLVWLKKFDKRFTPCLESEISIKKDIKSVQDFHDDMTIGLKKVHNILKDGKKIVFTFHNQNISVWNSFLSSIDCSNFTVEKVIHQANKRTGESNVRDPYGTSGTDFYIRCIKNNGKKIETNKKSYEEFVLNTAITIIKNRNEPTPYQILFNGILSELSMHGCSLENYDDQIKKILEKYINKIFVIIPKINKSGNQWWLIDELNQNNENIPLSIRVIDEIKCLLDRYDVVSYETILQNIFIKFPNGLTPDTKIIEDYLIKHAIKVKGKWVKGG